MRDPGPAAAAEAARGLRRRRRPPIASATAPTNTRGNIAHHYDLSNDLFALFLDDDAELLLARCSTTHARLTVVGHAAGADAQGRKIERLLDAAGVGRGTRVLEIGTGWGELRDPGRRSAARRSARVTLSSEQQALADERIADGRARRPGRASTCWTTATSSGEYDAVVSVEMIEAVG